jgi:hypothetical protein
MGLQERYGNISIVKGFKKARKQSAEGWLQKLQKDLETLPGVCVEKIKIYRVAE